MGSEDDGQPITYIQRPALLKLRQLVYSLVAIGGGEKHGDSRLNCFILDVIGFHSRPFFLALDSKSQAAKN